MRSLPFLFFFVEWETVKGKIRKMNWKHQKLLKQGNYMENHNWKLRVEKLILLNICVYMEARRRLWDPGLLYYTLNTTALAYTRCSVDSSMQIIQKWEPHCLLGTEDAKENKGQ